jgi:hypothetical protein
MFYVEYYMQVNTLYHTRPIRQSPHDWAAAVYGHLTRDGGEISHLTGLATYYLNNLVIPCRVQCNICWVYD